MTPPPARPLLTVAALFVARGGVYSTITGVDPWDEARIARLYAGPHPVVAHPPCARWCRLAWLVERRYPHLRRGEDGGCFASALASVRRWGGILEHPAYSEAWAAHGLGAPDRGHWSGTICGGWVAEVDQARYGHRARKRTWLYVHGAEPPSLDWVEGASSVWMTWLRYDGRGRPQNGPCVERMGRRERNATPRAFAELLVGIARSAHACVA